MISSPIPQDILRFESKPLFGLSGRQMVCLLTGAALTALMYFVVTPNFFTEALDSMRMMICAVPAVIPLAIGWYKPYGQPLEKIIVPLTLDNLIYPTVRRKEVHFPEYEKEYKKRFAKPKDKKSALKPSKEFKAIR